MFGSALGVRIAADSMASRSRAAAAVAALHAVNTTPARCSTLTAFREPHRACVSASEAHAAVPVHVPVHDHALRCRSPRLVLRLPGRHTAPNLPFTMSRPAPQEPARGPSARIMPQNSNIQFPKRRHEKPQIKEAHVREPFLPDASAPFAARPLSLRV